MNVFSKYYMNFTFNLNLTLGWKFSFVWFLIVKTHVGQSHDQKLRVMFTQTAVG